MGDLCRRSGHCCSIGLLLLIAMVGATAQENPTSSADTVFVFFQKTSGAATFGSRQLFEHVVNDLQEYLKEKKIASVIRTDDFSSGVALPLSAVQEMARNANATFLLYVVVDRPVMKWLQLTVECYNASGQPLWTEEASAAKEFSRGKGERDTLEHLHTKLNARIGQPGLRSSIFEEQPTPTTIPGSTSFSGTQPKTTSAAETPAAGEEIHDGSLQPIRLATGTLVHLFVAETISSKTAKVGDTVKLQVLGDVRVGDLVVIANKAPGVGRIETVESAGRAWHAGRLILKLQTVTLVNHKEQQLEAWNARKGADTGAAVEWTNAVIQSYGFALLALPFAPLQHGNQALLYKGTLLDAVTISDSVLPRGEIEAAQPKLPEPRSGLANATVYYPDLGHGSSVDIWCGQLKVGRLRRGGKLTLTLPPARYWLRLGRGGRAVMTPLEVESGAEQYVSVVVTRATSTQLETYWPPQLAVVPHDIGEAQSADATTAKSQHVLTADNFDLLELQADPHKKTK